MQEPTPPRKMRQSSSRSACSRCRNAASSALDRLTPAANILPVTSKLFPHLKVGSRQFVLSTNELGAIGRQKLQRLAGNLEHERDNIIAAIDMLFTGVENDR